MGKRLRGSRVAHLESAAHALVCVAIVLSSCGGTAPATPAAAEPPSPVAGAGAEAVASEREPEHEVAVLEHATPPTEREVLVDGMRRGVVLDELSGWRLVSGSGTVALVGPDGHVRAAHRFAFDSSGAVAVFADAGTAVVGNIDSDGFRGPWSGQLIHWDLDGDMIAQLATLGYSQPALARVGGRAIVADAPEGPLRIVGEGRHETWGEYTGESIAWPPSRPDWCALVSDSGFATAIVRRGADGALVVEPLELESVELVPRSDLAVLHSGTRAPVLVRMPALEPVVLRELAPGEVPSEIIDAGSVAYVRFVGAAAPRDLDTRSLSWLEATEHPWQAPELDIAIPDVGPRSVSSISFAPHTIRVALATETGTVVLGTLGIGPRFEGRATTWSDSEAVLGGDSLLRPLDLAVRPERSVLGAFEPWFSDEDPPYSVSVYEAWRRETSEFSEDAPIPPMPVEPICSRGPGEPGGLETRRCVRARLHGRSIEGWELFDPAHPERAPVALFPSRTAPPFPEWVAVAPGGRYLRDVDEEALVRILPLGGGEPIEGISSLVETETAFVWVDADEPDTLRTRPYTRARQSSRTFEGEIDGLTIVDAARVVVRAGDLIHVVRVADLRTERTIALEAGGPPGPDWACIDGDLVDRRDEPWVVVPDSICPTIQATSSTTVSFAFDRSFWAENQLGEIVRFHRVADDAEIFVRMSSGGVLVSARGGIFEGEGDLIEHVVVREPGPVREAAIHVGAEARARFERPGLVVAFFGGDPIPDAPP